MYASLADLRDEGVTEAMASDSRLSALIEEASQAIDRITGWFFEPRVMALTIDGRGSPTIEPPYPPIRIERVVVDEILLSLEELVIEGSPIRPGFVASRLTLHDGVFSKGRGNVLIEGVFGYTEEDGSDTGRTPLEIRRVCMLLVLRGLPLLAHTDEAEDARNRWRVIEERTRDQSYKLGAFTPGLFTGDRTIDDILVRYCRPAGLGAA